MRCVLLTLGLGLLPVIAGAQGPTFDCARATGQVEQLICKDPALSALDRKLGGVYAAALKKQGTPAPKWLTAQQRGWIKGRNDCWKNSDVKRCVESEYVNRVAELQARFRMVPFHGPATYQCGTPADEVVATFFETDPPTAIIDRGDKSVITYVSRSGSGAKYEGANVMFWEHQGEAMVTWFGQELKCRKK